MGIAYVFVNITAWRIIKFIMKILMKNTKLHVSNYGGKYDESFMKKH